MSILFPNLMVVGITGKIGAGKSTVAQILQKEAQAVWLDCDKITHELYQSGGGGAKKIATFFGETYLKKDGSVSRSKLRQTLLKNSKKWEILDRMIHPLVVEMLRRKLAKITRGMVVLEIPIYNSKLFGPFIDKLWVVRASLKTREIYLQDRKMARKDIEIFSNQQIDEFEGYYQVIENEGNVLSLEQKIRALLD